METDDIVESIFNARAPQLKTKRGIQKSTHSRKGYTSLSNESTSCNQRTTIFRKPESKSKLRKLRDVARVVLGILPSPATTERAFSTDQFLTETQKNRLSVACVEI